MATVLNNDQLLFPDFLDDQEVYQQVEVFWRDELHKLLQNTGLAYHSFYTQESGSGQKDYSGNPIFDAYFPDRHKLVRIIQYLPEHGDLLLSAYIDHWPVAEMEGSRRPQPKDPARSLDSIPELVIALALTREHADAVLELIRMWVIEDLEEEKMEQVLDKNVGQ